MYEPTQEIIVAELRLRGTAQMADIEHIVGPGFAPLIPYEIQCMVVLGRRNWYLPSALHWLPEVHRTRPTDPVPVGSA